MTAQAPSQDQIRDGWNATASAFDEYVTPITGRLAEAILDHVDIRPGSRFLDVAAGSGALSIPAARAGAHVDAVDIAPAMIERLRARAASAGLNIDGSVMDGRALGFGDGTFDVSASLQGVSVFPDMARGLAELVRVTKPGGKVLVAAFGAMRRAEFVGFAVGAMQAAVPGLRPPSSDPPPPPFQLANPGVFEKRLAEIGLTSVTVDETTWEMPFESAEHFWNTFTAANPVWAQLAGGLTAQQRTEVQRVLDGMLRERSGGEPGAVLRTAINIGTGVK